MRLEGRFSPLAQESALQRASSKRWCASPQPQTSRQIACQEERVRRRHDYGVPDEYLSDKGAPALWAEATGRKYHWITFSSAKGYATRFLRTPILGREIEIQSSG